MPVANAADKEPEEGWDDVPETESATGAFHGWGEDPNKDSTVIGPVTFYDPTGGTTKAGKICKQLEVELLVTTVSIASQTGERTDREAGERLIINAAQTNLDRQLTKNPPEVGDVIRIEFVAMSGNAKLFSYKNRNRQPRQAGGDPFVKAADR